MNPALFANPALFQAYQNDPGMAYGQALMQQGASTAPVRSPLEGFARALTAGVGGFTQSKVKDKYEGENEKYRQALAAALNGGDVLGALQSSDMPQLQQMALDAKLRQALNPADDPLVKVYDPTIKAERYMKQSEARGLQASAPQEAKAPQTRQIHRNGLVIDQQFDPATGTFTDIGSGPQFAPQQPQETWRTVTDPNGKPLYQESSLGQRKALPGQEGTGKPPSAADLRDEYSQGLKDYNQALNGFSKVVEAAKDPSPAGDLALIFGYMKTLDPTSTVREGEFATAQNAGSVPTQIQSLYNRIMNGERLTPDQRADFVSSAKSQFNVYDQRKQLADQFYGDLATRNGINPRDVLIPYPSAPSITPNGPQNPRTIRIDKNGNEVQ